MNAIYRIDSTSCWQKTSSVLFLYCVYLGLEYIKVFYLGFSKLSNVPIAMLRSLKNLILQSVSKKVYCCKILAKLTSA